MRRAGLGRKTGVRPRLRASRRVGEGRKTQRGTCGVALPRKKPERRMARRVGRNAPLDWPKTVSGNLSTNHRRQTISVRPFSLDNARSCRLRSSRLHELAKTVCATNPLAWPVMGWLTIEPVSPESRFSCVWTGRARSEAAYQALAKTSTSCLAHGRRRSVPLALRAKPSIGLSYFRQEPFFSTDSSGLSSCFVGPGRSRPTGL